MLSAITILPLLGQLVHSSVWPAGPPRRLHTCCLHPAGSGNCRTGWLGLRRWRRVFHTTQWQPPRKLWSRQLRGDIPNTELPGTYPIPDRTPGDIPNTGKLPGDTPDIPGASQPTRAAGHSPEPGPQLSRGDIPQGTPGTFPSTSRSRDFSVITNPLKTLEKFSARE